MAGRNPLLIIVAFLAGTALLSAAALAPGATGATRPGQDAAAGQAPAAAPVTLVAQHATFLVFVRGAEIGSEETDVQRTDTEWIIKGSNRLGPPLSVTFREAEARYSLDLKPRSLRLVGQVRDQPVDLTTTFEDKSARTVMPVAGESRETTVAVSEDTVIVPNSFFGSFVPLAARLARSAPGAEFPVFVAPQAEIVAVLDEVTTERLQTAARSFGVRRHRVTFRNPGVPIPVEIETEENGALVRVTVSAAALQVVRADVASVAARQQTAVREGDEDVRIPANGFNLAGTLSKPKAATPAAKRSQPAKLPAIVLVAGSGPVDRDETVVGIPIFAQLAGSLADAGYAVVRYDKRGVGQSGGRVEAATLADYADDLLAVVSWLRDRDDIDGRQVAVVGHSEGAWVGLLAASRDDKIARLVMIAGPGTTGAELILEQQQHALAGMQLSDADRQQRVELQKKIQAAAVGKGTWEGIPEEYRKQADTPYFSSLLAFDPAKVMPKVSQPLLIIGLELDRQVPAAHAGKLAALANARKKNRGVQVEVLPGLNHLLIPAKTGEVAEYGSLQQKTIDPGVARVIVEWLKKPMPK